MGQTQEDFLGPIVDRGRCFVRDFERKFFQKASIDAVMAHLLEESPLVNFPQLAGVVRERMSEFLDGFELDTPARYPNAGVG